MKETDTLAVTKYAQKNVMTLNKIYEDFVLIHAEDSPSFTSVKKWTAQFKRCCGRDCTKDDSRKDFSK